MKSISSLGLLLGFLLLSFGACSPEKKENPSEKNALPADVVNNPASAESNTSKDALPAFFFEKETYDFGEIIQGEKVSYAFKFKNTGKAALVISSASGSCGCTVPEWPKEAIQPGSEAMINVIFDSDGKMGKQNKTVTIMANTVPNSKVLTITGEVVAPGEKTEE